MANTDSESKSKDDVYYERNLLALAFISAYAERCYWQQTARQMKKAGFGPVQEKYLADCGWWPDTDDVNGEEYAVVWANLPQGQVGWHIPMEMVPGWLEKKDPEYDGYTTKTKNQRMEMYLEGVIE